MKTLLLFLLGTFMTDQAMSQTFSWSGYPTAGTSYVTGAMTATLTAVSPGFQNSTPRYYAAATVGSEQCGITGGLALEHLFGNITTANATLVLDFTSGGLTTGTCSNITFPIKDINSDESVQTFADWVEISAVDGNNTAIVVSNITASGGSNKVITNSGNTRIIKGYNNSSFGSRSSTACDNITISVSPPTGVPVKSITIKYHPDYTVAPNNYYNFTGPVRPAYQYISIGSITATATGSCVVLPVELISFTATRIDRKVELNWVTETESNNDYFVLERTWDGQTYETIGTVDGKGNSLSPSTYTFIDENTPVATVYYRLKQIDFDGKPTYHELVVAEPYIENRLLQQVYPNPTTEALVCALYVNRPQIIQTQLLDLNGRIVLENSTTYGIGLHHVTLDVRSLTEGMYQLHVRSEDGSETTQLISKTD